MSDVLPGRLQIQSLSPFDEQACAEVDMSDYVDTHGGGLWIGSVQDDAQTVYYEGVERVVCMCSRPRLMEVSVSNQSLQLLMWKVRWYMRVDIQDLIQCALVIQGIRFVLCLCVA